MSKKSFYLSGILLAFVLSAGLAFADIQSPIYTDGIGREHFLGRGGYSGVRHLQMDEAQSMMINDAVNEFSQKEESIQKEKNITDTIKEKEYVPASSHKSTFSSEKGKTDASHSYGFGNTNLPTSGVNDSKTIYTDELGRLHFFGKANQIKE